MIEPQSSNVNIPPTVKRGGFWSKLGAGFGGLAGAVGGFFSGGPAGAAAGAVKGAGAGYALGSMGDKPGITQDEGIAKPDQPMVRALRQDPEAQNYAMEIGKRALPQDDPRYEYLSVAQQKLRDKWGIA